MLRSESYKRGIVVSTGLNVVVKGILFLNTILIAYYFGTSIETDIYFYIFSTITLLAGLVNGIDLAVVIPEGMLISIEKDEQEARSFYNFFGYAYTLIGIFLFILLFFFAVPICAAVSPFNTIDLEAHRILLLMSSLLPLLMILSNYLTAVLTTLKYFTAPLIAGGIAQFLGLLALVIFNKQIGIAASLIGILAGYLLNIFLLVTFMKIKLGWRFIPKWVDLSARIKRNMLSVQLGNLATFAYNYGIILLLSSLAVGVYTAYTYSMQVVNIPNTFIFSQAAAVAGIKFNELAAKKMNDQMNVIFSSSMLVLMFLVIPVCFLTWLHADDIVKVLFYRGTFSAESSAYVALFIKYLIFMLPCMAINTFLSRLLISVKRVKESFYFQIGFNVAIFLSVFLFIKLFSLEGFVWSILAVYYLYFTFACYYLMKWLMPYIDYISFLRMVLKIVVLNLPPLVIAIFAYGYVWYIAPFLYVAVLLLLNKIFKVVPNLGFATLTK